jgi:TetR/AcrR family transcriptional regulator, regulator of cefoperazone and chloramphenicol sensitivity
MAEDEPRRRDRRATTAALRQAAMRVFAARGYDAATTREVAETAGVSEQLIQRYFGGKAGLLLAIMQLYAERDREGAFGVPPAGDTVQQEISNFLYFHLERERQAADFARVAIYRSIVDAPVAAEVARMFVDSREPFILARLQSLASRGLVRADIDLSAAAHMISTLSFALAFTDQIVFGRSLETLHQTIETTAQVLAQGLTTRTSHLQRHPGDAR